MTKKVKKIVSFNYFIEKVAIYSTISTIGLFSPFSNLNFSIAKVNSIKSSTDNLSGRQVKNG